MRTSLRNRPLTPGHASSARSRSVRNSSRTALDVFCRRSTDDRIGTIGFPVTENKKPTHEMSSQHRPSFLISSLGFKKHCRSFYSNNNLNRRFGCTLVQRSCSNNKENYSPLRTDVLVGGGTTFVGCEGVAKWDWGDTSGRSLE